MFRIAAESEEEEYIRSKLNKGEEPPQTEVHVLAGLIKVSPWSDGNQIGFLSSFSFSAHGVVLLATIGRVRNAPLNYGHLLTVCNDPVSTSVLVPSGWL